MKLTYNIYIALAAVAGLAVTGCQDDFSYDTPAADDTIVFNCIEENTAAPGSSRAAGIDGDDCVQVIPMASRDGGHSDSLYLHSEVMEWGVADAPVSRSNMVHSDNGMYSQVNVSAYHYTDEWSADKVKYLPNYFYYEGASGSQGSGYRLDSQRFWPTSGKMRFLGFAPYSADNTGAYQMANVDGSSGPYIHIEVDEDVTRHSDLLVTYSEEIDCTGSRVPVTLNFKHALTCVQFVMADDMQQARIKSISIKGVKYRGDMRFQDNMASKDSRSDSETSLGNSYYAWDGSRDFTLNLVDTARPDGVEAQAGDLINDETHSFLMYPQVLPADATVEILLSRKQADGTWGKDEVIFGSLQGKRWPAGKIVRYRVSNERWWQELQVSTLPTFLPQGGEQYFSITSYDTDAAGNKVPVTWSVKYEDPANPGTFVDANPGWYSFETANTGDVDPRSIKVTATALEIDHTIDLNAKLKAVGTYGTRENPYNLSTNSPGKTAIGTTANCYIVDRPGWYIIPLVYGNGVTGGSPNAAAYHPRAGTANGALHNFVNYKGEEIASPYILTDCAAQRDSIAADGAGIVWQDSPALIQNADISVDKTAFGGVGGIVFQVSEANIIQGNSVIGLKLPGDDTRTMWSWHIWVTPFFRPGLDDLITETIGITNHDGDKYNMLYTNLGWCSTYPIEIYKGRSSRVEFTAVTSDGRTLSKTLTVRQSPFVKYWHGRNTYYQWGRKDPFQPFERSWEQVWYDSDGNKRWEYPAYMNMGNGTAGLKERILNPVLFHTCDEEWGLLPIGVWNWKPKNFSMYTNLWDATYDVAPTINAYDPDAIEPVVVPSRDNVKSVYDPCPPGYKVPPIDTFTGFTNTGNNIGNLVDSPKNWNGDLMQYDFDCADGITQPYIYLFYLDSDKSSYIAMPLTGYRDWRKGDNGKAGAAYQMGNYGYSWTAGSASDIEGYYLELRKDKDNGQGWIMPLDYFWQLNGLPIRPCHE